MAFTCYEATTLNNQGASFLMNNNYEEAILLFQSSASMTKALMEQPQHQDSNCSMNDNNAMRMKFIDLDFSDPSSTEDSFICKSAIIISYDNQVEEHSIPDASNASHHLLPMIAISAIYNLAIAHHLYGIRHLSTDFFLQALHYYEISYNMQLQQPTCSNPTHVLSVLNNVAMIHRSMNDPQQAKTFLERLYHIMSLLDQRGEKHSERRWEGFWSNILCLVVDPSSLAAAAAA
eukprot:scaffold8211_cov117-Cylindrotheca_fusiformis.AAC.14